MTARLSGLDLFHAVQAGWIALPMSKPNKTAKVPKPSLGPVPEGRKRRFRYKGPPDLYPQYRREYRRQWMALHRANEANYQ